MSNKVLFFVDSTTFGGVEIAILQLMEGLDRNLWQPILAHHPAENLQPLIEKTDQLEIKRIETPVMPLGIKGMQGVPGFLKILRREQPTVFHAHLSSPLACKWGIVTSILAGIPASIVTEHLFLDFPYSRMARLQQRLIAEWIGKYITVSSGIAKELLHTFQIPKNKIRVIHNAVESGDFVHVSLPPELIELNKKMKKPLVLTVARLVDQKGHHYLLDAACQVPDVMFLIVGDGPEKAALQDQVCRLKLTDRVLFFGFQSNIPNWLGACDVFVLPSLYEGLPISILEAMAAGKPVIATDIPGNRETVIHGISGLLVPPQNASALATALRSVLINPFMGRRMGEAGREIVSQKFSIKAMVQQVTEVYVECLRDRR
jgi:glycosyltransferase involved in cell wall biosynthesis